MDDNRLNTLDRATSLGLIFLAVVQGCALYALHLAIDHEYWLVADQRWLKALYTVAVALPAFYLISIVRLRDRINFLPLLLAPPTVLAGLAPWLGRAGARATAVGRSPVYLCLLHGRRSCLVYSCAVLS
ncbi:MULTISPECIES: hypothetical protein [unclassified Halomonas]|uniref:hypothetical protein n=1 Tax=unclassified Halomonas TaxID=2609666 RepID=UPI0004B2E006|nr:MULTISPECIES: hypothetical protein [unclassified Halomonas]